MDISITDEWAELTSEEKKRKLYEKQKATLDGFLERGAITQQHYSKSLGDLTKKKGYAKLGGAR